MSAELARDGALEEVYFTWLYNQIGNPKNYWSLARQLYHKEFIWVVLNDDNRVVDGLDLRYEFLEASDIAVDSVSREWLELGCSVLEMLIALSRRLSFLAEETPRHWFWVLMANLGFRGFRDQFYTEDIARFVDKALDIVVWRTYQPSGYGGLFPLNYADKDQRKVELWYQLNAYLLEIPET